MFKKVITTHLILLLTITLFAQDEILQQYVEEGLKNNPGLMQQRIALKQQHESLNATNAELLPTVDFSTRYTKSKGGRTFEIPTGDMMNPVYSTLNELTESNRFPMIENQEIMFNRETDVDTRLSLSQPIFDRRILLHRNIQKEEVKMANEIVNLEKRELVAKIKKGYFNYLKMVKVLEQFQHTRKLARENVTVSKSLYENDKVTKDAVWRTKADLSNIDYQIAQATKNKKVAQAYFNYLLDRPLDRKIQIADLDKAMPVINTSQAHPSQRAEYKRIKYGIQANEYDISLARSQNLPRLYGSVDYGFQGTEYVFNSESDYLLASLVLRWNLFSGGKYNAKMQQSELEAERLKTQLKELSASIKLEVTEAYYTYKEAWNHKKTTRDRMQEAEENYRLVNKKFKEGLASHIDLLDARNEVTSASIQKIISDYDLWMAYVEYERATAGYPIGE